MPLGALKLDWVKQIENRSDDPGLSLLTSPSYTAPGPLPDSFPKIANPNLIRPFTYTLTAFRKKGEGGNIALDINLENYELLAAVKSDWTTNQNSLLSSKTNVSIEDFDNSSFLPFFSSS